MINTGAIVLGVGAVGVAILAFTRRAEAHPGDILLSDLVIYPSQVSVGEPVEISVTAINIGKEKATKEIVFEVL